MACKQHVWHGASGAVQRQVYRIGSVGYTKQSVIGALQTNIGNLDAVPGTQLITWYLIANLIVTVAILVGSSRERKRGDKAGNARVARCSRRRRMERWREDPSEDSARESLYGKGTCDN